MSSSISNSIIKQIGLRANKYSHKQINSPVGGGGGWFMVVEMAGTHPRGDIKRQIHSSTLQLCPVK